MVTRKAPASAPPAYTVTGTRLWVVELLPSCPAAFAPQQYAATAVDSTQAKAPPTLTVSTATPDSTPLVFTATGTELLVVELLPSWPAVFSPQQSTAAAL